MFEKRYSNTPFLLWDSFSKTPSAAISTYTIIVMIKRKIILQKRFRLAIDQLQLVPLGGDSGPRS
jgi:hypothetical protein